MEKEKEKIRIEKGKANLKKFTEIYFEDVLPFIKECKEEIYELVANLDYVHAEYMGGNKATQEKYRLKIPELVRGKLYGYMRDLYGPAEGGWDDVNVYWDEINTIYTIDGNKKLKKEALMLPLKKGGIEIKMEEDEKKVAGHTLHSFLQKARKLIKLGKEVYPGAILVLGNAYYGAYHPTGLLKAIPTKMKISIESSQFATGGFYFPCEITEKGKKIVWLGFSDKAKKYRHHSSDRTTQLISYRILNKASDYFSKKGYKTRALESIVDAIKWDESIEISKLRGIRLLKQETI